MLRENKNSGLNHHHNKFTQAWWITQRNPVKFPNFTPIEEKAFQYSRIEEAKGQVSEWEGRTLFQDQKKIEPEEPDALSWEAARNFSPTAVRPCAGEAHGLNLSNPFPVLRSQLPISPSIDDEAIIEISISISLSSSEKEGRSKLFSECLFGFCALN